MPYKEITPERREVIRENWKRYYNNHPEYHKARRIKSQQSNADYIDSFKLKCAHCDNADSRVLDFHHIDESTKLFTLASRRVAGYNKEKIKAEIDKCLVLCANCHRLLHWEQDHADK